MAQLSMRAAVMLAFGILCVRIAGRRTFARASPLDIIVNLIVGSNLSRVITGKANVFPTMAATLTLAMLHRLLSYVTLRKNPISSWIKAHPTVLVRAGVSDQRAMARQGISPDDLLEALRLKQVEMIEDVKLASRRIASRT
jgi:uncharacterized membrane protein YcaP (DUF421 family)